MPTEHVTCLQVLRSKWEPICALFGMRLRNVPQQSERRDLAQITARYSGSRINAFTRNELQQMLNVFERRLDGAPSKAVLVNKVAQLQADLAAGDVELDTVAESIIPAESVMLDAINALMGGPRKASLRASVMKPQVSSAGIREGSQNEVEVLRAIPQFLDQNIGAYARQRAVFDGDVYAHSSVTKLTNLHISSAGLIESGSSPMIGDSPDAIHAWTDQLNQKFVCAAGIKTMTALATVNEATILRDHYGAVSMLSEVGSCEI